MASASGDALFVIGGFAGYELNDVQRFELAAGTWDCPDCCSGAHQSAQSDKASETRKSSALAPKCAESQATYRECPQYCERPLVCKSGSGTRLYLSEHFVRARCS